VVGLLQGTLRPFMDGRLFKAYQLLNSNRFSEGQDTV